jgi:flavin reductase (DIM6/NTAB) family NADH-FMN oxidoreductase RutF
MHYDPRTEPHGLAHNPWLALVAPRPIGWISSVSASGVANLAPYSFFNAMSIDPPFVAFGSGGRKDSLANIEETGCFAINMVTRELGRQMVETSGDYGAEVDEFELAGLTKAPCHSIAVPRVAESPVCIECRLNTRMALVSENGTQSRTTVVVGEVVGIHIDDEVIRDGMIDPVAMGLVGRLGYLDYTVIENRFAMPRPQLDAD